MKIELQERYMNILRNQVETGLNILEKMSVKDKNYQQIVVNINNANNISFQLQNEIEKQKQVEVAQAQAMTAPILAEAKPEKRKYTKRVK